LWRHNTRHFNAHKKSLMDSLQAWLIIFSMKLTALLPLSVARRLGRGLVYLLWPLGGRSRRVTELNIRRAFPKLTPQQQQRLARDSMLATGELAAEMGHVWMRSRSWLDDHILKVEGAQLVTDAQQAGRGVIVLGPHLGNWEVLGLQLASLGSTVALYEPPAISALGPVMESARQRTGATLVPTDSRGLVKLLKSVKAGKISGILPDQVPPDINAGRNVEFMGIPCFTGTLAINMIQRTGALAVFGFAMRVAGGFEVHYLPAGDDIYDADPDIALRALNRGVETCLQHCVEQYQWEYKRFKTRPPADPEFYAELKGL
jgi:KDO2-lipid IV(A) lauroyltransferase